MGEKKLCGSWLRMAWGKNEDDEEALSGKFVLWRGGGGRTVRESERERARDVPK